MIRAATLDDYPAFAALFPELGVDDPVPPRAHWPRLAASTLVEEDGGRIRGYLAYVAIGELGHVRNLVVARDARNAGIGRRLMRACADVMRAGGVTRWMLNVAADNATALRLYQSLGLAIDHRSTVMRLAWAQADALPREPARALPISPEDDADVEATLGLPSGRILMDRGRGRALVQLRDATLAAVGYAALDPELPSVMPFRVARIALAGTLLDALRSEAAPRTLQIVVENNAPLAELLIGIGAQVRLQLLHLSGPLPG